jgi:hypothetical protein
MNASICPPGPTARGTRHRAAATRAVDQPLEREPEPVPYRGLAGPAVPAQQRLDLHPRLGVDDRGVLAGVVLVLVLHPPDVGDVGQELVQAGSGEHLPAAGRTLARLPPLVEPAPPVEFLHHGQERFLREVHREDGPHPHRLVLVDGELGVGQHVVAEDRHPARPLPLAPRGGDLVPRPLRDDLALELGEGQEDVERQPPHRVRGVELLRHRDERHLVLLERLHDPGEVEQAAGQPVHLVDHHAIDPAGLDVRHQPPERGRSMFPPVNPPSS